MTSTYKAHPEGMEFPSITVCNQSGFKNKGLNSNMGEFEFVMNLKTRFPTSSSTVGMFPAQYSPIKLIESTEVP